MKRRDFLKIIGVGGAGAGLGAIFKKMTNPPGAKLYPYVTPPEDIVPGVANWYSTLCTACGAGCGAIVRVMEGRAKKMEGNPAHPVNKGGLCARGQASLQSLYNPDRIKTPLKRKGDRGKADFAEITWEEAISTLSGNLSNLAKSGDAGKVYALTTPMRGHLDVLFANFMSAYGSPNYMHYELFERRNLTFGNQVSLGTSTTPHYDIENTKYLLSFGADFSSTWLSPVSYSRAYAQMRQGSLERGKLVQVEPRMSLTGANADEWVPAKPGTEAMLALAIAYAMCEKGYARSGDAGSWRGALAKYRPSAVAQAADVPEERIYQIAKEFGSTRPSLAVAGDGVALYQDGVSGVVAVNILNHLAGGINAKGGVVPNPEAFLSGGARRGDLAKTAVSNLVKAASEGKVKALIVYNANPVFTTPREMKTAEALGKIPFIASFSTHMDETTAMADIVLPSHDPLEDWGDDFTSPSVGYQVATIQQPAVAPVFGTMSTGDILIAAAKGVGGRVKDKLPSGSFKDYIRDSWKEMYGRNRDMASGTLTFDEFWHNTLEKGGWWKASEARARIAHPSPHAIDANISPMQAKFEGSENEYPFYLTLYPQAGHRDGSGANLPWIQELPDPMTSVVWGSWVEINPKTAAKLGIKDGDTVTLESPFGKINVPVYLYPAIRPDTVSVPIGQGHTAYGRYAKDRGVNPIEILPYKENPKTGEVALNSTRVRITRVGPSKELVKMEGSTREFGREIVQTISPEEFRKVKKEEVV